MSVEQYSNEVIVVAAAEGPSAFKLWLREEVPTDLASNLQWLWSVRISLTDLVT